MNILEWELKLNPLIIDNVNLILSILKDGDTFIDIGANTGLLSKLVLEGMNNKNMKLSKHIMFEPIEKYCNECKIKFGDTAIIEQFALSDTNNDNIILASTVNLGYNKIYKEGMEIHPNEKYSIQCKIFSEWADENNINKIDFIKIDTEGHDIEVIRGMFDWLEKNENRPYILFEAGWYIDRENEFIHELETKFGYESTRYNPDVLLKPKHIRI
jgi:FkbM family methyltransferase